MPESLTEKAARLALCAPAQVLVARIRAEDGALVVVIDRGVGGCPKLIFAAAQLAEPELVRFALRGKEGQFVETVADDADGVPEPIKVGRKKKGR